MSNHTGRSVTRAALALLAAAGIAACAGGPAHDSPGAALLPPTAASGVFAEATGSSPIKHVIIIVQENRSFDDFFARFPRAEGATQGTLHNGKTVKLKKSDLAEPDLGHAYRAFVTEYDGGKMDGFDLDLDGNGIPVGTYPYQYVDPAQIQPYWTLAKQYVLADHMFQTQRSGSFTAHQDLIAGGTAISPTASVIDDPSEKPWGCDAPEHTVTSLITIKGQFLENAGPFPCFKYATLRDRLDAKHVSWKYYAPALTEDKVGYLWNAFDAIRAVRKGPEWTTNVSSPETNIFADLTNGSLPAVSWLIPDAKNSDHPGHTDTGPSWVAQVVNAVGHSSAWNSTAIVIVWDDWGGFYDNVVPPHLDYQGLGFRVPCLLVGAYARRGVVDHTQYEFGSILKFVENNWNLKPLGTTDVRATSIADAFDLTQKPRKFVPVAAKYPLSFFEHETPSGEPVDNE